jgi:hypothetical protein
MARIIGMSSVPTQPSEITVAQPPPRSKWRRWWPWLSVLAIVGVFLSFLGYAMFMGGYREAQMNQLIGRLQPQGVRIQIDYVFPNWMGTLPNYLPEKVKNWLSAPESVVTLFGRKVTADTVIQCLQLPAVRRLAFFDAPSINGAALKPLADAESLQFLTLTNTRVSGEGFPNLERLPRFEGVRLTRCPLTEAGLEHLLKCARIETRDNIYVGSIKLGDVTVTNGDGSEALKAGDSIAVHGSFTSPRFAPVRISMDTGGWYRPDDNYVTPSNDGTYRFFIESPKSVLVAGRHKMKLSVKLDQRSSIWVEIGEVDFVVKLR